MHFCYQFGLEISKHIVTKKKPNFFRDLYKPSSTIYQEVATEDGLADILTPTAWDESTPSGRSKEVRPYDRHAGPRGCQAVRSLGHYKVDERKFQKL